MDAPLSLRRYTLLVTALAAFLAPFMSNSINVALLDIGSDLNAATGALNWVVAVYLLAAAATLIPLGRAADLYGRRRVFLAGLFLHGISSILAALARSPAFLVASRALQGIGGAMLFATGVAMLTSVYPPAERGRVLGINAAATYIGLSLGPVVGGFLTDWFGWRSIFVLSAVVCIGIVPLTLSRVRGEWAGAAGERFDRTGAILYGLSLIALVYGISSLRSLAYARWLILGGTLGLVLFVVLEARIRQPLLDLRRFRGNIPFLLSNLAALIHYSATFAVTVLLSSYYLQGVQGMRPEEAGRILIAQPVMMALLSPAAGWLSDRIEPRLIASGGMAMMSAGLLFLSTLHAHSPLWIVVGLLLFMGAGFGFFSSPNTNAVMSSVAPRDYGIASSSLGTMRLIGQTMSMAMMQLLFSIYVGDVQITAETSAGLTPQLLTTMQVSFRIFAGLAAVGVLASLARGRVRQ